MPTWPAPNPTTQIPYTPYQRPVPGPPIHRLLDDLACTRRRVVMIAGFSILAGLLAYGGFDGVGIFLLTVAAAAVVVVDGGGRRREAWLWAGAAIAVGALPVFRASPWVTGPAVVVAGVCLVIAALVRFTGSGFDVAWLNIFRAPVDAVRGCIESVPWLTRKASASSTPAWTNKVARGGRAALVAVPLVVVIVALLASADAAFRGLFTVHFNLNVVIVSLFGCGIGFGGIVGLMSQGLRSKSSTAEAPRGLRLGRLEQLTALISVSLVLAVFISVQLATTYGKALGSLAGSGVSVAQYARSGWFQLLAVVTIDALVVIAFRSVGSHSLRRDRVYQVAVTILVLLSLGLLVSSLHRLSLYDQAYGWTMLRLACWFAATWIGLLLVLLLAQAWNLMPSRNWLPGVAILTGIAVTLVWGIANPAALVARHDLARGNADASYLLGLGPDAIPTLLADRAASPTTSTIRNDICISHRSNVALRQYSISWTVASRAITRTCQPAAK
jgi:two-component system sensor histidine kinase BaeS